MKCVLQPKDPNEPSMDIDTMRKLAASLVLQASGELPDYPEGERRRNQLDSSALEIKPKKT